MLLSDCPEIAQMAKKTFFLLKNNTCVSAWLFSIWTKFREKSFATPSATHLGAHLVWMFADSCCATFVWRFKASQCFTVTKGGKKKYKHQGAAQLKRNAFFPFFWSSSDKIPSYHLRTYFWWINIFVCYSCWLLFNFWICCTFITGTIQTAYVTGIAAPMSNHCHSFPLHRFLKFFLMIPSELHVSALLRNHALATADRIRCQQPPNQNPGRVWKTDGPVQMYFAEEHVQTRFRALTCSNVSRETKGGPLNAFSRSLDSKQNSVISGITDCGGPGGGGRGGIGE